MKPNYEKELRNLIAIEQRELRSLIKEHRYNTAVAVANRILIYCQQLNTLPKPQSQEVAQ